MEEQKEVKKKLYDIIIDDILAQIESNDFTYDDPICTEKQLCEKYGVSRITAKRAITELEYKGILYRVRGQGSFVSKPAQLAPAALQPPALSGSSKSIAFILPFEVRQGGLLDTVNALHAAFGLYDYLLAIYITGRSSEREKVVLNQLFNQDIAGIIYYPSSNEIDLDILNKFVLTNRPVVIIDKNSDCSFLHNVHSDNVDGGELLTRHLIELGHTNIAFFTRSAISDKSTVRDRFGGVVKVFKENHMQFRLENLVYVPDDQPIDCVKKAVIDMCASGITAIVSENDEVAYEICSVCKAIGIHVPNDISVCGFDNEEWANQPDMPLTTIDQDFYAIGKASGELLLDSLANYNAAIQKTTVPVQLIVRNSTKSKK